MKKLLIALGIFVGTTVITFGATAGIPITVPTAPGAGYCLYSLANGKYTYDVCSTSGISSSTNPLMATYFVATSTTATSTFLGNLEISENILAGNVIVPTLSSLTGDTSVSGNLSVVGNVGIGVTPAQYTLDVNGTGNFEGGIVLKDSSSLMAGNNFDLYNADDSSFAYFGNASQVENENMILFSTGGYRDDFVIANNGNVGIGTSSPYAKLSVLGPVVASYIHATSSTATSTFDGDVMIAGDLQVEGNIYGTGFTALIAVILAAAASAAAAIYAVKSSSMGTVIHGATANTARPSGYGAITWIGSVAPDNAITGDTWVDTT